MVYTNSRGLRRLEAFRSIYFFFKIILIPIVRTGLNLRSSNIFYSVISLPYVVRRFSPLVSSDVYYFKAVPRSEN